MSYVWKPHPGAQTEFCRRGEFEVLYGGQAGPGKTDCLVALALTYIAHPKYRGVLFRRTLPRMREIEDRAQQLYPEVDPNAVYKSQKHEWQFSSGAKIQFGQMQYEDTKYDYKGAEYHFVGFDELTEFTETQYKYMFSRARSTVPGIKPIVRATSNPGGIGHKWVKDRFRIGQVHPGETIIEEHVNALTGEVHRASRVFIPGTLQDNPTLLNNDPDYVIRLMQLPEIEKLRLLHGVWDAFEGQAFAELNADIHSFDFEPDPEWPVFMTFDWGYAAPWSVGYYATDFEGRIYRFREIYGCKEGDINKGTRQTDQEIAREIRAFEQQHKIHPKQRIADPAIWSKKVQKGGTQGPSVAENMGREGLHFNRADNNRIPGRQQVHRRLMVEDDGLPMLMVHQRCNYFWETMPMMVEDEKNPEDLVTKDVPDHIYDEVRYACMWRPLKPKQSKVVDINSFQAEREKLVRAQRTAKRYGIPLSEAYVRR